MIDYKLLLEKYMIYLGLQEGTDFVEGKLDAFLKLHVGFTEEEWGELKKISRGES